MSKNPPIRPAKNKLSVKAQNENIVNDALASLSVLNEGQRGTRIVTKGMAKTIAKRSLERTETETYSLRRQRALAEVSQFANTIKKDKPLIASASNADLLPIAHPQSARPHRLDSSDVYRLQARWYADDPRVTDPLVVSLLASAFTAHPRSSEYEYSVARLSAMGASEVTLEALVAAFRPGANNFYWMRQLRGRDGRFIKMGGAIKRFVRRLGKVFSLAGRMVSADPNSKKVTVELPNGKLVRYPAAEGEAILALVPSQQSSDGFSKNPVSVSASDPVIDEANLEFVDSPDGWGIDSSWEPSQDDKDYYGENLDLGEMFVSANDNYEVIKFEKANFPARNRFEMAQQKEAEENDVIAYGKGENDELDPKLPVYFVRRKDGKDKDFAAVQSWVEVQELIRKDEELYEEGKASNPQRPATADELDAPELPVGRVIDYKKLPGDVVPGDPDASSARIAAYERKLKKFNEEGGEFPLDPRRSYFLMNDGTIADIETGEVLRDSQGNAEAEPAEPEATPEPVAQLPESQPELLEGFDYEKAKNDPDYVDAFLDGFDAGIYGKRKQDTADSSDSRKDGIDAGYALGEKKNDEAIEKAKEDFPRYGRDGFEAESDEALSEAISEIGKPFYDELDKQQDNASAPEVDTPRDETPEAGERTVAVPEGFYDVDRGDYFPEGAVNGQESDDFTDDPAQLAQEYSTKDLQVALAEAVRGSKETPANGFGQLPFSDGLEVIPAEALYKALDEKGEDANQILDDIYAGGDGDSAPDLAPEVEVSLGEEVPEAPRAEDSEQEIPPLIDGLTEDEKNEFLETGDYKKYLPENKVYEDAEVPEGYAPIDNEAWTEIEGDLPEDAPEGFSMNPVDIANNYNGEDLVEELRRALEPGNPTPGYGILGIDTPEGEEYFANVPAEAIRDALQLQGVDTDPIISAIFDEGFRGQGSDEPNDSEIQDAIDGENIEEVEDGREPGQPGQPGTDGDAGRPRPSEEELPESDLLGEGPGDDESPWSSLNNPLPEAARAQEIRDLGDPTPGVFELDPEKDAEAFRNALLKLKENNKFAASVYVYELDEYKAMQLFATADGTAGFAIKPDGDIVSVFVNGDSPHKRATRSMLAQAVEQGGTKLDAYDTVLPKIYADAGFRPVSRARWNEEFAPDGWNKEVYETYNNGEPDVVAMVYDPTRVGSEYDPNEGKYYGDYDAAIAARDLDLEAPRTITKDAERLVAGDEVKMPDGTFLTVKKNFSTDSGPLITFDDGSRRGVTRVYDFDDVVEVKATEAALEALEEESVEERQSSAPSPEEEAAPPQGAPVPDGSRENIEGPSGEIARRIEERALLMSPGRGRENLPEIPAKYRRQVFIRLLAGLYADFNGNPLAIGDKVIHRNPNKAAEFGEGIVEGKIQGRNGGIQRGGVVYVDYVTIRYPNGNLEKFAAKFQRHVDENVARRRFAAEPRINWMNVDEMREALEERRKKPRNKPEAEAVQEEQAVQKTAAEIVDAVSPELVPDAPDFEFTVDWVKANIEPQDIKVGDIQVGDFMVTFKGDNVGRVVQILDLDAAAQIEVEYSNGRRWTYNPYNKNFLLRGIYRLDDDNDGEGGSGGTPVSDAPQGDAPQSEAPQGDAPEVEAPEEVAPEGETPEAEPAPAQEEAKTGDPFVDVDDPAAIKEKLLSLAESLPKFRGRGEKNQRWARREIERLAAKIDSDLALHSLRVGYSIFEYSRNIQDDGVKNRINSELDKLNENLDKNRDKLKQERKNELIEKLNTPLDDINVSDSMSQNEIMDALRRIKENLPESKDRGLDVYLHRAGQEIEALMDRLTIYGNTLDKISDMWYKDPLVSIERGDLDPEGQKKLADKLSQINEVIAQRAKDQFNERNAPIIERFKNPVDFSLFPADFEDLTNEKVIRAINEVMAILPNRQDREGNQDVVNNPLFRANEALGGYVSALTSEGLEAASDWRLSNAIERLKINGEPKAIEIANELEKLKVLIDENKQKIGEKRRQEYEAKLAEPIDPSVLPEKPKDVTVKDIKGFLEAVLDKLPLKEESSTPVYMREAGEVARRALKSLNEAIETNNLDNASAEELDIFLGNFEIKSRLDVLARSIRNGFVVEGVQVSEAETALADFVEEAARKINIKQDVAKIQIANDFAAKRAIPLPEGINLSDENNSKESFDNLLSELIQRLPKNEIQDRGDVSGVLARQALVSYKEFILQSNDPVVVSKNSVDRAIGYLRNAAQDDQYAAVIDSLEKIQEYIFNAVLDRPVAPFAGVNLEEIDPIERAEQRARDRENLFKVAPEVRELFQKEFLTDDIDSLVSENNLGYFQEYAEPLKPFRDELIGFFNGEENPMAQLSIRARQALSQTVSRLLKDTNRMDGNYNEPEIKPLTEEQKTSLVDLAFALQTERDFYQPQRDDVGEAGRRLLALDPEKFMDAARNKSSDEEVFIDGQATGFTAIQSEDGVNSHFNFFVTDIATGQRFVLKREGSRQRALAETQAAEVIKAFNIGGRYSAEVFPDSPEHVLLTFAGDALRTNGSPENFEGSGLSLYDETPDRAVMIDTIAMTLVDAVISNTDRHDANFMVVETDLVAVKDNGHENLFILPVDHGYAGLFNGGETGNASDVKSFLIGADSWLARDGGILVRNIGVNLGGFTHKQIIDRTVTRAIENLKKIQEDGSSVIGRNMYSRVISRLEEILDIRLEEWTDYLGGKP